MQPKETLVAWMAEVHEAARILIENSNRGDYRCRSVIADYLCFSRILIEALRFDDSFRDRPPEPKL